MASFRLKKISAAAILLCAVPCAANAHLVQTGFGDYYDGIAHFALSPQDILMVIAVALLSGMRGAPTSRATLIALPSAWLVGGIAGMFGPMTNGLNVVTTITFGILGLFIALNLNLAPRVVTAMAVAFGLLHGYANGATLTTGTGQVWLGILGIASAIFVAETLLSAFVVSLKREWMKIAVRVAGSWIAAIGLLMLGWFARGSVVIDASPRDAGKEFSLYQRDVLKPPTAPLPTVQQFVAAKTVRVFPQ